MAWFEYFIPGYNFYKIGSDIVDAASDIVDDFTGVTQTQEANATNVQLAREQMQWNEKMWKMQNEYNTPANQLARYKEAGLNPNLIYGSITGGNASNVPTYNRAEVKAEPSKLRGITDAALNLLGTYQSLNNFEADIANKQSQNNLLNNQAAYVAEQAKKTANEANYWLYKTGNEMFGYEKNKQYAPYYALNALAENQILSNQVVNSSKQGSLLNQQIIGAQFDREMRKLDYELRKSDLDWRVKLKLKDQINDLRKFNASMEWNKQKHNSTMNYNIQKYNSEHSLQRDRYNWERRSYLYDVFNPKTWFKRKF